MVIQNICFKRRPQHVTIEDYVVAQPRQPCCGDKDGIAVCLVDSKVYDDTKIVFCLSLVSGEIEWITLKKEVYNVDTVGVEPI